jgi:hypothetical protein
LVVPNKRRAQMIQRKYPARGMTAVASESDAGLADVAAGFIVWWVRLKCYFFRLASSPKDPTKNIVLRRTT